MSAQSRIKPFDAAGETSSLPEQWETWKNDLDSFFLARNIEAQREKKAQLAYLRGPGLQEILRHLPGVNQVPHVTDDPPYYDVAIQCLDNFFEPFRRKTYERHLFHQIVQQQDERFTDFVMRLRKQIARCSYNPSVVDELIADRIAQGCKSQELRTKFLQKDRTLDEIIALGTSLADSFNQSRELGKPYMHSRPDSRSEHEVNWVTKKRLRSVGDHSSSNSTTNRFRTNNHACYSCGRRGHVQGPAKQTKCAACGKTGHWAKRCYSTGHCVKRRQDDSTPVTKAKRIRAISEEIGKEQEKDFVFYAMGPNVFNFEVGGVDIPMTIDSGADANIITRDIWEQMKEAGVKVKNTTTKADRTLMAYADKPLRIAGMFCSEIEAATNKADAKFYVVEDGQRCLLDDRTAKNLQVLKVGYDVEAIRARFSSPFPKIRGVIVEIPIDEQVQPVQQAYRRPPIAMERMIEEKLDSLLELDIIELAPGPSPWVSPFVPVLKDTGEVRLCVDMRRENQAVLRETHPLPLIEELLSSVSGAVLFSKIDIKDAYHQVEISERSRPITTFITKRGLYR
ncbi:uncharacterized protein LOC129774397 [Toxorhynchites rutilus septentrionalis]|uniref:uncharacterized protein LOC129774397 n=1 Tax=Toxorhynchites rutilus septentrionalis TaxID=329112 RepID=UPI00247B1BCB|nr:uncharacterized protein LOC129774397 [Toxorhynchites rutilus septentrionalis]